MEYRCWGPWETEGGDRIYQRAKIIGWRVKEVFWENREAGAGENLPAVAAGENTINSKCHVRRNGTFIQTWRKLVPALRRKIIAAAHYFLEIAAHCSQDDFSSLGERKKNGLQSHLFVSCFLIVFAFFFGRNRFSLAGIWFDLIWLPGFFFACLFFILRLFIFSSPWCKWQHELAKQCWNKAGLRWKLRLVAIPSN